jgi:hypothetical protein
MAPGSSEQQADRCLTCRGRGWLNLRTRPVYRPDALTPPTEPLPRETAGPYPTLGKRRRNSR